MKIVIATSIYPPEIGRPSTYIKEVSVRLADNHKLITVAYTNTRETASDTKLVAISKRYPVAIRLINYFVAIWKASRGADLIYVQNAMSAGLPVALVSILRNKPFVLKFLGNEVRERSSQQRLNKNHLRVKLMSIVQNFVLHHANIITVASASLRDEVIKIHKINNANVIINYNPADNPEILPFETKHVPYQIAYIDRLSIKKNTNMTRRAFSIAKKKYPKASLVAIKNISRAETWHIIKGSSVFVYNSGHEIKYLPILISFAVETPVISINTNGTSEFVKNEVNGLLVKHNDEIALAQAIENIFENNILSKKLTENGKKSLEERFSWKKHLETLNGIFQSVLHKP